MSEIAEHRIYSLRTAEEPTAEDTIFAPLTEPHTGDIAQNATVVRKIEGSLDERLATLEKEFHALRVIVESMRKDMDVLSENQYIQLKIIADLRHKSPTKATTLRAARIEKYLQARPDHRATLESLRGFLGADKHRLNEAVKTLMSLHPGRYTVVRAPGDKRKKSLVMLPK